MQRKMYSPHNKMPDIQFHCSIRENDIHSAADMATVIGNEYFRQRDIKSLASCLEAFEKLAYFSI
jgi:hypothetical protein